LNDAFIAFLIIAVIAKEAINIGCEADYFSGQIITRGINRIKNIGWLCLLGSLFCAEQLQWEQQSHSQYHARRKPAQPDKFELNGRHFEQILHNVIA